MCCLLLVWILFASKSLPHRDSLDKREPHRRNGTLSHTRPIDRKLATVLVALFAGLKGHYLSTREREAAVLELPYAEEQAEGDGSSVSR